MMESKRVAIVGATGFVGRGLAVAFRDHGWSVTGLSRVGAGDVVGVSAWQRSQAPDFSGHTAVVNLSGEPIDQRWSETTKRRFHESRVGVTETLVAAMAELPEAARPKVLVNASAVGIYGNRGDETLTEESTPGNGYLAGLCRDWEAAAVRAESLGIRVVRMRIGVVLGRNGSAFKKLLMAFKSGIGGRLGSGRQWMPWIHVNDLRAAIVYSVVSQGLTGAVNGTAPDPETNADFTRKLAKALRRPALFPVPGFALRLVLGEFGEVLLASQRALPKSLDAQGFQFQFPELEAALDDLTHP